jgi:hypothetical protein
MYDSFKDWKYPEIEDGKPNKTIAHGVPAKVVKKIDE